MPSKHYMIPASGRLPQVPTFVARELYFVVHAPRQTGKTTTLQALAAELTDSGQYAAVKLSLQSGRGWGDDIGGATRAILSAARRVARVGLPVELRPPAWPEAPDGDFLGSALSAWAEACARPLVLFLDEIDSLEGSTLTKVLSQIRDGFELRPRAFPASIALCGLRDVRDYKVAASGSPILSGGPSPFNIVESLRLGDFTIDEVRELYSQHTGETGQAFAEEAVEHVWALTAGQPWLVNALAAEIVDRMKVPTEETITIQHVNAARERIVETRPEHLNSLVRRLREPEVRRVLEPILAGSEEPEDLTYSDDRSYVRDLGLVAQRADGTLRIANPIYAEVVARALTQIVLGSQDGLPHARDFVRPDGQLDVPGMLVELSRFWRSHEPMIKKPRPYQEAIPHFVLMAWIDRSVNGDGTVYREHAAGTGRADIAVRWEYAAPSGRRAVQYEAFEVKTHRPGEPDPLDEAMTQLDGYPNHLSLRSGYIVIFDQRPPAKPNTDGVLTTQTSPSGHTVTIARLTVPTAPQRARRRRNRAATDIPQVGPAPGE